MTVKENSDTGLSQEQVDYLAILQDVPAVKLNADMYAAEDIDGGMEGLTGSGNLNYLVLQSAQTNEARQVSDPFSMDNSDQGVGGLNDGLSDAAPGAMGGEGDSGDALSRAVDGDGRMGDLESGPVTLDGQGSDAGGIGGGTGGGIAPISALSYNSATSGVLSQRYDGDEFNDNDVTNITNPPGGPGTPGGPGGPGDPGASGGNGNNGNNGDPGGPGPAGLRGPGHEDPPGGGGDDVDLTIDLDTGILDSDYDINLDLIEEILGDLDIDIDGAINDILNGGLLGGSGLDLDLDHLGNGLLDLDSDNLIGTTVTELEGLVNDLVDSLPGEITGLVTNPLGILDDLLGLNGDGDTDIVVNLVPNLPLDIPLLDMISLHVPLDPVEALVGDLDINIDTVLADILNGNILQDTDLLLGAFHNDNDLLSLAADDILQPALDLANGLTGNMLDSILNGPGAGDTDISIGILSDLGLFGGGTSDVHIPLDAVETVLGDIDADIDNLLSLDTILDADGLSNGDLPGLDSAIDIAADILPGFDAEISLDDLGGSVEDLLGGLDGLAGDVDVADTLTALADNLTEVLVDDGDLLGDFIADAAGAPEGELGSAVEGLLGDIDSEPGDADLTLDTGLNVLGVEIDDIDVDVPLDIVEAVVGDIDIDVDAAGIIDDAMGGDIIGAVDAALGVDAELDILDSLLGEDGLELFEEVGADAADYDDEGLDWPEASITDGLDDLLDGAGSLDGAGEVLDLPDPVGVLTDGLGSIIDDTPLSFGSSGGGGLFGGLFG